MRLATPEPAPRAESPPANRADTDRPLILHVHPETLEMQAMQPVADRCQSLLLRRWSSLTPELRWACLGPADAERLQTFIASFRQHPPEELADCVVRLRLTSLELSLRLTAWPQFNPQCSSCLTVRLCQEFGWATSNPEIEQIAHDLRGGLQSLVGLSYLAPQTQTVGSDWTSALRASVSYVADLADGLELAARPVGRRTTIRRSVQVCQLLNEVRDYFLPQAQAKRVDLRAQCCSLLQNNIIQTDAAALRRVLHNLVGNAIKYIKAGEVTIEAQLVEHNQLEIRIRDTGPGLDPNQQRLAFRPYVRLSTSRGTEGSGLGLAIVRQIVERAGGQVQLFSRLGEGTELVVSLPVQFH